MIATFAQLNSDLPSLGTMSPSFDGSDIDESSIVFYRIGVDNWAAMGCNSAGIPIMAYGTNQSDKTVYQFNRDGITINNEIKLVTNADLGTGFVSSGAFTDIVQDGIYYISNNVIGKPGNAGGTYILASPYGEATTQCGLYIENLPNGGVYKIIRSGGDQQHIRIDQ